MTTTITIRGRRVSTHGGHPFIQRFDIVGPNGADRNLTHHKATSWLMLNGVDHEHALNLLNEALVSPVSTEV